MRRLTWVVISLFFAVISFVSAQNTEPETWNWAWKRSTGELFAYSSQGEANTLLPSGLKWIDSLWRVGDDHAVALLQVNDTTTFYDLPPQSAQTFALNFDLKTLEVPFDIRYGYRLEAYSPPYMLFTPYKNLNSPPSESLILMNLDTKQIDLITNDVGWGAYTPCCRFTEDGQRLRYKVVSGDYEKQTLVLHERILATGEDRVLFTLSGKGLFLYPDTYGERWLLREDKPDTDLYTIRVLYADGTSKQIYEQSPSEFYTNYEFADDNLISYQPLCQTDCVLQLETKAGDKSTFKLPLSEGGSSYYLFKRVDDEHLVIGRLDDYWLVSTQNEPKLIGYYYRGGSGLPPTLSPDNHWLLVVDTSDYPPTHRAIWDLLQQKIVVELSPTIPENPVEMIYDTEGFIVDSVDTGEGVLYRYADEKQFNLPDRGYGIYFEILPDGSVLYQNYDSSDADAIYRYYPNEDKFSLLIQGADYITATDANFYTRP